MRDAVTDGVLDFVGLTDGVLDLLGLLDGVTEGDLDGVTERVPERVIVELNDEPPEGVLV